MTPATAKLEDLAPAGIAGQPIAVRITGDTDSNNNGLFFHATDHLGSVMVLSKQTNGDIDPDTRTFYEPFGDRRLAPTDGLISEGYTGHKHNDSLGLVYMKSRYYVPSMGKFASPDIIVPNPLNPQSLNRYSYTYNNPVNHTDPSGNCIFAVVDTIACLFVASKIIDYGMTAWDGVQAGRTLADPNASRGEKIMAALNISMAVLFEAIEPDDLIPIGLPIDDVARRGFMRAANEAFEEGGEEALERYLRDELGDNADTVLNKIDDALGSCAFNSFSAETLVETVEGPIPIDEIEVGDRVLAYNEATGEIKYYSVTDLISHVDLQVVYLTIDGETVVTTAEHPFYTDNGEWVDAGELQIGDGIRTASWRTGEVEAIAFVTQPQPMYNFTVATAHTYFVGDGRWLVHNSGCGSRINNIFSGRKAMLDDMAQKGIEGADGFQFIRGQKSHVQIKNQDVLDSIQETFGSTRGWVKTYEDGYDALGNQASYHYFLNTETGQAWGGKIVENWSN